MEELRTPKDSLAVMTQIVLPNDTNTLNNLFGGQLLSWMDRCCAIAAHRHCKRQVVTSTINNVAFKNPIPHGAIVTIEAKVSRAFSSSMEIIADVYLEEQHPNGSRIKANEGIFTFVAVDQIGSPINVPAIHPETHNAKHSVPCEMTLRFHDHKNLEQQKILQPQHVFVLLNQYRLNVFHL